MNEYLKDLPTLNEHQQLQQEIANKSAQISHISSKVEHLSRKLKWMWFIKQSLVFAFLGDKAVVQILYSRKVKTLAKVLSELSTGFKIDNCAHAYLKWFMH